ncbi:MAG: hypothetical protein ACSHW1_01370 [Yoonia sp.]|uniref:hypothetical protein n=1 Tax=Yoonia sp. TaxID=2212373 RepID=UPI003EF544FC
MTGRKSAQDVEVYEYFAKLRENVVLAELALMQLVAVTNRLKERETLADELRLDLEVQEQALKDMLVLGIARLFDLKGKKQDQLSIPNICMSKKVALNANQRAEISRLASLPAVKTIRRIRDTMVAHSLSHASDMAVLAIDIMPIIDGSYAVLADIYKFNSSSAVLERKDISAFSTKWSEMTESWC